MSPREAGATDNPFGSSAAASTTRRKRSWLAIISAGLLGAVVIVIVGATLGVATGVWRFVTVESGSMSPVLQPGDVAILRPERLSAVEVGQIALFHPSASSGPPVIHRVVTIGRRSGTTVIQTKGDANNAMDSWKVALHGGSIWYESFSLPGIGYVAVWSQQVLVRLFLLLAVVAILVSFGLPRVWRTAD